MKTKSKLTNSKRVFYVILTLLLILSIYILIDLPGFIAGFKAGLNSRL